MSINKGHIIDTPYIQYNLTANSNMIISIVDKRIIITPFVDFRYTIKKGRLMTSYLLDVPFNLQKKAIRLSTVRIIPNYRRYFKGLFENINKGHIIDTPYIQYNLTAKSNMINVSVNKLTIITPFVDFRHTIKKGRGSILPFDVPFNLQKKAINLFTRCSIPNYKRFFKGLNLLSIKKGRGSILPFDVPFNLQRKANNLTTNDSIPNYKRYFKIVKYINNSRLIIRDILRI